MVNKMNREKKERKTSSYLRCLISTFIGYKNKRLKLIIDGEEIPPDDYITGAIANGRIFGKGMKIAPQARLDDELFDIVLVKGMKAFEFLRNIWKIYSGTHLTHPKISMIRGKRIEAIPDDHEEDILIELDGEQCGKLPATFEICSQSFCVKSYL